MDPSLLLADLQPAPPHDQNGANVVTATSPVEPASTRIDVLCAAVNGKVNASGQGTGTCPVCKRRGKLTFHAGDRVPIVMDCKVCLSPGASESERTEWFGKARAGLPDVPEWVWGKPAPARRSGPRVVPPAPAVADLAPLLPSKPGEPKRVPPTEGDVRWWVEEMHRPDNDFVRRSLGKRLGLDDAALLRAEIGLNWEERQTPIMLPVRDPMTGTLLTVIRRDFTGKAEVKSKIWQGSSGAYLYAPFGIRDDEPVLIVAGERDVLTAQAAGFNAVAFTNGEGTVPSEPRRRDLSDRDLVLAYDIDEKGRKGAQTVAAALAPGARTVCVADLAQLAGLPKKGDVSDVLASNHGAEGLSRVIAAALPWEEDNTLARIRELFQQSDDSPDDYEALVIYDDELMALDPPTFVVDGWVPRGFVSVFWGKPGVYKTFLLNEMMRSVRIGQDWQGNATERGMTLMLQGEGLEQLQPRIEAWDSHHDVDPLAMEPGGYLDVQPNITTPEGVAAVARTVRAMEARHGRTMQLVVFDPLVEFVPANDRVESTDLASRGLRALAMFLGCAVVVGHHANADGERARGTDHLHMRSGSYVRMEDLEDGRVGVLQHKIKSRAKQALILRPVASADSVVLQWDQAMLAEDYVAQKEAVKKQRSENGRASAADKKSRAAGDLIVGVLTELPGLSQTQIVKRCMGKGYGKDFLEETVRLLVSSGLLRVEEGARGAHLHYVNGTE